MLSLQEKGALAEVEGRLSTSSEQLSACQAQARMQGQALAQLAAELCALAGRPAGALLAPLTGVGAAGGMAAFGEALQQLLQQVPDKEGPNASSPGYDDNITRYQPRWGLTHRPLFRASTKDSTEPVGLHWWC